MRQHLPKYAALYNIAKHDIANDCVQRYKHTYSNTSPSSCVKTTAKISMCDMHQK